MDVEGDTSSYSARGPARNLEDDAEGNEKVTPLVIFLVMSKVLSKVAL